MTRPAALLFPDNPAALVTARELGHAGVRCLVLSHTRGPASYSRHAEYLPAPDFYRDASTWVDYVRAIAGAQAAAPVLFPTEDAALLVADRFHARLADRCRYPYSAPGVVPAVLDKRRLYELAAEVGVATPEHESFEPSDDEPAFDRLAGRAGWIAKPACRYWFDADGRIRTFLALSGGSKALDGDLVDVARTIHAAGFPVVAQELVPGPFEDLFSVGVHLQGDEVLGAFFARKRCEYPVPYGDGLIVEVLEHDPGILDAAVALLRKAGYSGICDVELKRDERDGSMKLLDANPRVWLWHHLGARSGYPMALGSYRRTLAAEPDASAGTEVASERDADTTPPEHCPRWVSPRGALAYLALQYRPWRDGVRLGFDLATGATATVLRDLRRFRDPVHLRPSAWSPFFAAAVRGLNARAGGGAEKKK